MNTQYDAIVVGAGIHGAGAAQALAAAGHSVLLLERTAIAAGTSSRSSKLIHGGLRYLETGQWRLVRESLRERSILLSIAPQLVQLQRFFIPVYHHTRRRPWQLRLGLSLYALLGGCRRGTRFGTVPRRDWDRLDGLQTRDLQAVFWYQDGQTDDQALTRAVVQSALSLGARVLMPAQVFAVQLQDDGVCVRYAAGNGVATAAGDTAHAADGAAVHECTARVLVNAAGPWAVTLAQAIRPAVIVPPVECVQGTHLLLPLQFTQGIYYVESPRDGRAVFVMPWHGQLLVGTTETRYRGDPLAVTPTSGDIQYLLGVLKHYFPALRTCTAADLSGSFAGLRVLPRGAGHAFHRPRETLLVCDRSARPRVLSIYGGKLTGWRAVSARVLGLLAPSLPARRPLARTDRLPLRPG